MSFGRDVMLGGAAVGAGSVAGLVVGIGIMMVPRSAIRAPAEVAAPVAAKEERPVMVAAEAPPEVEEQVIEPQPADPPKPAIVNNPGAVMGPAGGGPRGGATGVYVPGAGEFGDRWGKK